MRPSRLAALPLALLVAVAAACGSDRATGPSSDATYVLESVGGNALPYTETVSDAGDDYAVRYDAGCCTVVLKGDGSYARVIALHFTQTGVTDAIAADDRGAWTRSGSLVTFVSAHQTLTYNGQRLDEAAVDTSTATLVGDQLRVDGGANLPVAQSLIFRRH